MRIHLILILALFFAPLAHAQASSATTARVPILVELFTSEGCSDCPPADAFLQDLDQQPFPGLDMIVLSEHVDYWNHDGWKDPYSSSFFTERQVTYEKELSLKSPYTPQMVIDGSTQVLGSRRAAAADAFNKAAAAPKIDLRLSAVSVDSSNNVHAHIETAVPVSQKADVYLAIALNHAEQQVSAGENKGRSISHVGVARTISKVGSIKKNQAFAEDVHLKLPPDTQASNLRIVAFVQQGQGKVLGAAMQSLAPQ
jgi:hypothetical protein